MKKRILSILLCFCMALSLLPMSVLAADLTVSIGTTNLTAGKYYTVKTGADPSFALVDEANEQPAEGTPFLYFSGGKLNVSGDVSITSTGPYPLTISGDKLTIDGSGSLSLISSNSPAISMSGKSSLLYLSDRVNFSAQQTGTSAAPTITSGSMGTEDGYSGNITVSSNSGNAFNSMSAVDLQTTGNISITGGGSAPVISANGAVTLKGGTVSLINSNSSGSQLIVTAGENVSVTADTGDLLMSGSGSLPLLEAGSSGTGNVTLSAPNGAVSVNNTGSGVAVNGNLSADAGGNVTVESTNQHAVAGSAAISADGDVAITSQGSGTYSAVVGALTVSKAKDVTVTSAGSNPTVLGVTDITADGNVSIQNTSSGMAVGNTLTATSTNGSVTVEGKHTSVPTIAGITTITAAKDIRITSASPLDIGATEGNTLTAGGFVIRSKSTGTTITKDGTPITAAYGGDVSTSGLNFSGKNNEGNTDATYNAPAAVTLYKAGDGYALFTPATTSPTANAKLDLHGAEISTTNATAISLPPNAPVNIVVASDSSITAGGNGNVIATNGQDLSIIGEGSLTLAGPYYGINVNGNGLVNIDIDGDLTFDVGSQPISTGGNITVSAKSITSKTGYYFNGNGISLTAKHGDISLTTKNSYSGAVSGTSAVSLLASEGAVIINHADNAQGGYALNGSQVMVSADKDVTITTSRGGISASSGVSVSSTTGSIQMDCAMDQCVSAGNTVTLNAPKNVTLNDSSNSSTAVQTSGNDVYVTAGGTLTSSSAYGFQTGALTIKANEVSIEGAQQDGIQATSVSITNPIGGNCKHVSITATSSDSSRAAIHALGSATTGNITVKADDLFLCGNGSAKAISALGTVTIDGTGIIVGAISAGNDKISAGIARASKSGGKISDKLDLKTNTPTETTYYEIDNGIYIIFAPKSANENAVLTLHNVYNAGYLQGGVILPDEPVTLKLEGVNVFFEITASNNIVVSGNGLLDSEINNSNADATVTVGDGATLNAMYRVTAVGVDNITVYGNYFCDCVVGDTTKLKLNAGAVMKLEYGRYLEFKEGASLDKLTIGDGASIVNNTHVALPKDTTVEQIKALPLSGTGIVRVAKTYDSNGSAATWDTYTNDGVQVNEITGGLDLTAGVDHSGKTVANDGYAWDSANHTLTLGNHAYVSGGLTLPEHATIHTTTASTINGSISPAPSGACNLTFSGIGSLNVNGNIGNSQGGIMTVSGGAHVGVNGSVNIGTSGGAGGTLNVTGADTTLNVSSPSGYAIFLETVNIGSGASVMATAKGEGSIGVEALTGGVHVTGGSTLTTGCAYGVYIEGGKLEVDSTSKLVTNGAVAPFCIVDTASSKVQDNVLSLPGTPKGTAIKSVTGTTDFSGKKHTYWSLTDGGNLNVVSASENTTPVTLTGAKPGTLTFVKASSDGNNNNGGNNNSGGGGSGGSSGSLSYTLNFETNGGSKISNVSKDSGSTVDLASYKPTRDGYDFDGWYANQALTEKVTSVKLTKHTTIYAKWTEKSAKPVNPFADVSETAYYHDAVLWAVQKNVTSGTTNTAFSPDMICTRAQMVTFLWRAMGSTEPTSANCPFTDVSKDAYYNKAVLWAVEKGITAGVTETSFSPDATVSRGQSVTFLWRAAGKPEVSSANPYTDVSKDAFYYNAMLWAVEKGITKGTSATSFSPDGGCTRSQIVTFLYRYMGK